MIRKKLNKFFIFSKFYILIFIGKYFGISCIVKYLRNPDPFITIKILVAFGAKIGKGTTIKRAVYLDNVYEDKNSAGDFSHLIIGENCYIGDCCYFDLANEVILGNNVVVSGRVSFVTHADCNRSEYLKTIFPRTCEKIVIQDGAWIAFNTTLLNKVTVGENAIISAYSLVKENVEKYCLYAGIPALKIKTLRSSK